MLKLSMKAKLFVCGWGCKGIEYDTRGCCSDEFYVYTGVQASAVYDCCKNGTLPSSCFKMQ